MLLVILFCAVFTACDTGELTGQAEIWELPQSLSVERFVVPEYVPLPRPGQTLRILSPILQGFEDGRDFSISITTPEWVSRYRQHVIVCGRTRDSTAEIVSLWWEVLDTDHRAEIMCDPDGYFEFAIPTLGLPAVFYLRIAGVDSRGRTAERMFGLIAESTSPRRVPAVAAPPPAEPVEDVAEEEEIARAVEEAAQPEIARAVEEAAQPEIAPAVEEAVEPEIAPAAEEVGQPEMARAVEEAAEEEPPVLIPVLTLTRPGENAYFSGNLPVSGKLIDSAGRAFPAEEIESFSWEVEGSDLKGELALDEQGGFRTKVDAASVRQDAPLILRAVAANGRVAQRSVNLRADISAPVLEIHSPGEGELYEDVVVVRGSVVDRLPVSLHWRILGVSGLAGQLSVPGEGSFQFDIPTRRLAGIQIFELRATDQLGNTTVSTVTLKGRREAAVAAESTPPTSRESTRPPQLIIDSPPDRSYYHSLIVVKGLVLEASSLYWEIPGSARRGNGIIGKDGSFSLQIPSANLQGTQMFRLTARGNRGEQADKVLVLLDHEKGPEITLTTPENRSYYRREIQLEGSVGNPEDDWDSVGEVAGLSLRIEGTQEDVVEIPFAADGRFSFNLPAAGFSGKQTLILTAEDRNGDLNQTVLTLLDGNLNPSVILDSPRVDQLYGSKIRVRGAVIDPYADSAAMGGIESVSYDVTSPEVFALVKSIPQGQVELRDDNSFDFVVTTRELSGTQDVNILVRGRSGNQTKSSVRILEGEADIPVFSVEAGDRRAVLRWDPLPSAGYYSLSYRTVNPGQRQGREARIDRASSPYLLTGLTNGSLYVFRVKAVVPGEPDSESAEKWAIPLSADTLQPVTAGEFEQIRISWPSVPGTEQYELWRSTRRDGEYTSIAGALSDTNYLDRDVQYGRSYFYKVTPASVPEIPSNPVLGQSTAFPVEKLETVGICRLNQARGLSLYGGYAFVAAGSEGVKIIDISVPDNPTVVGGLQTAEARDIAIRGEYAFLADGERGLKVLDISDPRYPAEIGMRKTMDARAIALKGDVAFIADGSSGLKIIDVSSPVQPTRIGSYATDNASDLAVRGSKLYVADGRGGLRIFEVSGTAELIEIGHLPGVDVLSLAVEGSFLYLACGTGGLIIMDISAPDEPVELGRYAGTEILDVGVSGAFAYLVDSREGLIVLDASDPTRPWQFASLEAEGTNSISVRGYYAYLANASGLQVVHILIQGRSVPIAAAATGGKAYGLSVSGPRAYVACHDLGVRIVDISDPAQLGDESVIGSWSGDYAVGIEVADSVAFVASGRRGLSILDLSPPQPEQIGSYFTGGTAHRSVVHSGLLFVADGREGLKILDVSVSNNPVEIGSVASSDARDVAVLPGYALIADGRSGLIVCDISDPGDPVPINTLGGQGVHRVVVQDTLLAVTGKSGAELYDFSDPRHPKLFGRYESEYVESIFIDGDYLYIAEGYRGLQVLDVRSFDRPVQVSACGEIYAVDVAVHGGYALVADSRRIHVVEVLIPEWLRQSSSRR